MSQSQPTPVARILARLDDALGAKMPPRGIERVVGPGLTEISVRRWRDGEATPTGPKAELFAEALGLSASRSAARPQAAPARDDRHLARAGAAGHARGTGLAH